MEDVSEKLLADIQRNFNNSFNTNKKITKLYSKARDGTATYAELHKFAQLCGDTLEKSFSLCVSPEDLPNERMYWNIAEKLLEPLLGNNHQLVCDYGDFVQSAINKNAGIGIKAIRPELDKERVKMLVAKISHEKEFADATWLLEQPITNITLQMADDYAKANFDFHAKSGLNPTVTRVASSGACSWCKNLAGTYNYNDVSGSGNDIWKRHDSCRCMVLPSFQKHASKAKGHSFQG